MKKFIECDYCDGDGFVIEELSGKLEPWLHEERHVDCMKCERTGKVINSEYLEWIDELIDGMKTRITLHCQTAMLCKKGMLDKLANKYVERMDLCSRALGRLQQYRKKLVNLL